MQFNIPTWLTLSRIIIIPFFVLFFYFPFYYNSLICAIIFIIASITDWCDGFLARKWNQTTRFGAFLDPVADKVTVAVALILIDEHFHSWWITLPASIIIAREIVLSALREWMSEIGRRSIIAVSWIGKIKTIAQMLALAVLLWRPDKIIVDVGIAVLYIAAFLTFFSMIQYLYVVYCNLFE